MLIKYIRTPKHFEPKMEMTTLGFRAYLHETGGDPIGIIVSNERNHVGWALCNPKDKFNKDLGKTIALNRADSYGSDRDAVLKAVPDSIREEVIKMYDRSQRYYK